MNPIRNICNTVRVGNRMTANVSYPILLHSNLSSSIIFNQYFIQPTKMDHKNMTLQLCTYVDASLLPNDPILNTHTCDVSNNEAISSLQSPRPLAVLLIWLAANEKHVDKYKELWLKKGFDVLTVRMTIHQFFVPKLGVQQVVYDLVKFLYKSIPYYPDIVFHCFSVGAYEFGEILTLMKNRTVMTTLKEEVMQEMGDRFDLNEPEKMLIQGIKGVIFDSPVDVHGATHGVARSLSSIAPIKRLLENSFNTYLSMSDSFATKHYRESSKNVYNFNMKIPALIFASERDEIATADMSKSLVSSWQKQGVNVDFKCFQDSKHVQHYAKYQREYVQYLEKFLTKISFDYKSVP